MTRPYRLRVVPSSPERMVARLRELSDWVCWFEVSPDNPIDCRRDYLAMYGRCARLLIRWAMRAHAGWAEAGAAAPECCVTSNAEEIERMEWKLYSMGWVGQTSQRWPGDDVARGQMEEK
jgi:hypothetical protein